MNQFSYAQDQDYDRSFGDVTIADFFNYDQSYDSTSPAIVLFDKANVYFDYDYNVIMERHTRIKVLNESGLEYGDVQFIFNRDVDQKINDIKAATYTIQEGEIITKEVSRRDVFEENLFDDIYAKKFSMPNVVEGSILEYSYQKVLGNPFQLPDWEFHKEIPVEYSSVYMRIPWRFKYHMVFKGTDTLYTTKTGTIDRNREEEYFIQISKENLPPVEDLPFIDSRDDFISKVFTQLSLAYRDNGSRIEYLKDWEQIAGEIRDNPRIGKQRPNRAIRRKVDELVEGLTSEQQKIEKIFEFVASSMEWNGRHQVITEKGIRDTFDEQSGSSGDINILLYEMLKRAGIKVSYALTSTRSNGMVLLDYPLVNQFNTIFTIAEVEGEVIFLDASDGNRSLRLPPVKELYQVAYVVQDDSHGWVEIKPYQNSVSNDALSYSIDSSGRIEATLTNTSVGYIAENRRNKLASDLYEETKSILGDLENLTIDTVVVKGMEVSDNTAVHLTKFSFDAFNGDSLKEINYLNPLLFLAEDENLLERPTREFPVFFPYPVHESKKINITLPEGYTIDEAPESAMVVLPDNKGTFNFQVKSMDSSISITSDFTLSQVYFQKEEYEKLREMFLKLSESHSEAIVIKRIKTN